MVITVGRGGGGVTMDSTVTTATVGQQVVNSQNSSQCRVTVKVWKSQITQCKMFIQVGQSQTLNSIN